MTSSFFRQDTRLLQTQLNSQILTQITAAEAIIYPALEIEAAAKRYPPYSKVIYHQVSKETLWDRHIFQC